MPLRSPDAATGCLSSGRCDNQRVFSLRELDRYRRWSLAWVLGPLVLGGLIVVVAAVALRAPLGFPNDTLAGAIHDASRTSDGSPTYLRHVTDRRWDTVCVFPPYISREGVNEQLGFTWSVAGGYPSDTHLLLVFLRDDSVVTHTYVERGSISEPGGEGDCRGRQDERTQIIFGGPSFP